MSSYTITNQSIISATIIVDKSFVAVNFNLCIFVGQHYYYYFGFICPLIKFK